MFSVPTYGSGVGSEKVFMNFEPFSNWIILRRLWSRPSAPGKGLWGAGAGAGAGVGVEIRLRPNRLERERSHR